MRKVWKAVFREKDIILTDEELLILKILNEGYNIKDDKLIKEYGFKSVNSFYNNFSWITCYYSTGLNRFCNYCSSPYYCISTYYWHFT